MIKQSLEIKQTQKLSPLQIQTIKFIEMPVQELEQRVRAELEENPVLEDGPDPDADPEDSDVSLDQLQEDDYIPSYRTRVNNYGKDERPEYNTFSVKESFIDSLYSQLGCRNLNDHKKAVAAFIIGSLDEDGYLRRKVDTLVDDLAFKANIETDEAEVEELLAMVQEFEPTGVGARDLRECLLLQLKACKPAEDVQDAILILTKEFEEFSARHLQKVMDRLSLSADRMKAATAKISRLNPAPGGQIDDSYNDKAQQIVPDFRLIDDNGEVSFDMPRFNIPELRVNRRYAEMLMESQGASERAQKEAAAFVRHKLDSAKWMVEALKQRKNTLEKTMQAILDYQRNFFTDGDDASLRPMILEDIAQATGYDISTISRVVNSKYIDTPFGVFPLKYFFSEGMKNQAGEEISTKELKKALLELIDSEDKTHPLTDEQIVAALSEKGYNIARRTIAEYRGQLGIPLARWRKTL